MPVITDCSGVGRAVLSAAMRPISTRGSAPSTTGAMIAEITRDTAAALRPPKTGTVPTDRLAQRYCGNRGVAVGRGLRDELGWYGRQWRPAWVDAGFPPLGPGQPAGETVRERLGLLCQAEHD